MIDLKIKSDFNADYVFRGKYSVFAISASVCSIATEI